MEKVVAYGIRSCDTMKKALHRLEKHQVPVEFHDYKSSGISGVKIKSWASQVGWETLLNRKGLTWRRLDEQTRSRARNASTAIALMQTHPSIIRRPVLEQSNSVIAIGFNEIEYRPVFGVAD